MEAKLIVKNNYAAWLVCFTAALFPFFAFIQMSLLNVLGSELIKEYSINHTQISFLSAIYIYADALLLIPVGLLLDRYDTRNILLFGLGLTVFGTTLFASAHTLFVAQVARFLTGCGHAFALLSCFKLVTDIFPAKRQALVIGLVIAIAITGGVVAQTPLTLISQYLGWRTSLWINVVLGVILFILIASILYYHCTHKIINKQVFHFSAILKALSYSFLNVQNWLCGFYICFLSLPLMILGALWGTRFLISIYHLSPIQASFVTSMIFIGTIIGSPIMGWIADRLENYRLAMAMGACLTFATFLIILSNMNLSLLQLNMLFLALGFFASIQVVGYPMITLVNAKNYLNSAMGFTNVLIMAGCASMQLLFGWLLQIRCIRLNCSPNENYYLAMSSLGLVFAISIILPILTCKKHNKYS